MDDSLAELEMRREPLDSEVARTLIGALDFGEYVDSPLSICMGKTLIGRDCAPEPTSASAAVFGDAFRFTSAADGLSIQTYTFPARGEPRAAVVIAHGAAEHARRYERFARALNAAAFTVYAPDHRGHGASQGPSGLGDFGPGGWDALVADLAQLIGQVRASHPGLPVALFAHSMGSFAAQQYCLSGAAAIEALVLSGSTALGPPRAGNPPLRWQPNAAFEPARTPYDWLSRDAAEVDKYIADPLCGFEAQGERRRSARPDFNLLADPAALARLPPQLPVLLLAGDADPLNRKLDGLRLLEQRWREAGVRRIDSLYYAGGRHEMLNEVNREAVIEDVIEWLRAVLGSTCETPSAKGYPSDESRPAADRVGRRIALVTAPSAA